MCKEIFVLALLRCQLVCLINFNERKICSLSLCQEVSEILFTCLRIKLAGALVCGYLAMLLSSEYS